MKYLTLLLFVSCANTGYKMHDNTRIKYTVREFYLPVKSVETKNTVPSKVKPRKAVKKAKKVDCGRVLREINQCVK